MKEDSGSTGLIPGSGRSPGGGHGNPLQYSCLDKSHQQRTMASYSPWGLKESDQLSNWECKQTDLERSGEGNGTPLQYSCLKNPMDRGAWWAAVHEVAESWTWLSDFTFTFHFHALEKEMATHSSVLAWRIPGMGEPGRRPSRGSHRVGHDWSDLAAAEQKSAQSVILCDRNHISTWVHLILKY